jgi:uncharacterized membrane protein YfcA
LEVNALATILILDGAMAGALVGFVLGLIGGGGSILAVPLLVYFVGVSSPHVAIGTSAVAVATSAMINVLGHAREGRVKWPCALTFSAAGIAGAAAGASLAKAVDGGRLLALFGVLMLVVGVASLLRKGGEGNPSVRLTMQSYRLGAALVAAGLLVGALSGFFGIGGGFLIVPALMLATGMPMGYAVGTSLVAVTAFGLTTAFTYAASGLVDWPLAAIFILGGLAGGYAGIKASAHLGQRKGALGQVFGVVVVGVGLYVVWRGLPALSHSMGGA